MGSERAVEVAKFAMDSADWLRKEMAKRLDGLRAETSPEPLTEGEIGACIEQIICRVHPDGADAIEAFWSWMATQDGKWLSVSRAAGHWLSVAVAKMLEPSPEPQRAGAGLVEAAAALEAHARKRSAPHHDEWVVGGRHIQRLRDALAAEQARDAIASEDEELEQDLDAMRAFLREAFAAMCRQVLDLLQENTAR